MGEIIDKLKEKAKDVKDTVVDTTKDVTEKTKETIASPQKQKSTSSSSSSFKSSVNKDSKYGEGAQGTKVNRKGNPLTEYKDKEPMTPAKINKHEPTAVKRNPSDQKITPGGQTGTDTQKAQEQYRKRGMTKINTDSSN
jgi:hypothetical protein